MSVMTPTRRIVALATALGVVADSVAGAQTVSHPYGGVTVVRDSDSALVVADLCATGVSVRATAYGERNELASAWAARVGARVAINADFFTYGSYSTDGRARGNGMDWPASEQFDQAARSEWRQYWQFGPASAELITNSMVAPSPSARDIVGGHNIIISGGTATAPGGKPLLVNAYRHTAIGLSADQRTLFMLAVNNPVTAPQLAARMLSLAAAAHAPAIDIATNQDGGGSTQMYVAGLGTIIPSTRPVANHLGIFAGGTELPGNCSPAYAGQFVAQSFPGSPTAVHLTVGETMDGWFELRNVGTATWRPGTTRFAPTPRDAASPLASTDWLSAGRVVGVAANVATGSIHRFPVRITGNHVGDFTQTFSMLEEGVTWFGTAPLGGGPADTFIRVHVIVSPAPVMDAGVSPDAERPTDAAMRSDVAVGPDAEIDTDDMPRTDGGSDAAEASDALRTDAGTDVVDEGGHQMPPGCGCRAAGQRSGDTRGLSVFIAVMFTLLIARRRHPIRVIARRVRGRTTRW